MSDLWDKVYSDDADRRDRAELMEFARRFVRQARKAAEFWREKRCYAEAWQFDDIANVAERIVERMGRRDARREGRDADAT